MAEVKKNIQVVARIRPNDPSSSGSEILSVTAPNKIIFNDKILPNPRTFEYDRAYDKNSTNEQIYSDSIDPLINKVFAGYNAHILTYGGYNTGKSHTLLGSLSSPGIILQSISGLFRRLDAAKSTSKYFVSISCYHVHGTAIVDLLHPNSRTSLPLLQHRSMGSTVEGISEFEIINVNEAVTLVKQALAVGEILESRVTNLGKPHTFVDFRVEVSDDLSASSSLASLRSSTLRFVSFASLSSVSHRLNPGLSAFTKVVDALVAEKQVWMINFNESKLTALLEHGLGGNAFCVLLLTLNGTVDSDSSGSGASNNSNSPASLSDPSDTLFLCEIGEKVKRIKNVAKVNRNTIASAITSLRDERDKKMNALGLTKPGVFIQDIDPSQLRILKSLNEEIRRVQNDTWEERRKRSMAKKQTRPNALEEEGMAFVLNDDAESIGVPDNLIRSSRALLMQILNAKLGLEELETNTDKLRAEIKQKTERAGGKLDEGDGDLKRLSENENKLKSSQNELNSVEEEYRQILSKIVNIEAKQKKMFLMGKDSSGIDNLNKTREWEKVRKMMNTDPELQNTLKALKSQYRDETLRFAEAAKTSEWERDHLWAHLLEMKYRHQVQMNRYQEHMFFIFRNYRSHFEEQKGKMESRYRSMLENSIRDALKLAEENSKLKNLLERRQKTGQI